MSKIKSIIRKNIKDETLMNLAVREDESFVANGIVVHNCKSYLRANLKSSKGIEKLEMSTLSPTSEAKKGITL
jgi:hypothetical protein